VKIIIKGKNRKTKAIELRLLMKIIKANMVVKKIKVVVLLLSFFLINIFHININIRGMRKLKKTIVLMDQLMFKIFSSKEEI
tara:strand:+ start:109 stop:354 length:246 start_codon:yes stop_codon:yes gene_type:complete